MRRQLVPQSLPPLTWPAFDPALWQQLLVPALLISVIGFVESVSVAQTLAAKRRQRIVPDQELIGLGAANVASALSGGYPREVANEKLARNHGMIASFSRALADDLRAQQSDEEFDATLNEAIESIYQASLT